MPTMSPKLQGSITGEEAEEKQRALRYRSPNPWPAPKSGFGRLSGRGFRSTTGDGDQFGWGSVCSSKARYGLTHFEINRLKEKFGDESSAFGSGFQEPRSGFGGASSPSDGENNHITTRSSTENVLEYTPRRGPFCSSTRSAAHSSTTRRSRNPRRTGRRGRGGPGHCFHCGEHGHISKLCPKKGFTESEDQVSQLSPHPSQMSKTDDDHPPSILSVGRAEIGTFHSAKLENQKARESYYNAQAYGSNPLKKEADIDKFSEQLDNALKIDGATITTTLSPQSKPNVETATTPRDAAVGGVFGRQKFRMQPQDVGFKLLGDSENTEKAMRSEMLTIETRRTVMREGGSHFEEQTIISFPRTLPPNVRVITAQFVPVATQSA